jgi:hypothetical protein
VKFLFVLFSLVSTASYAQTDDAPIIHLIREPGLTQAIQLEPNFSLNDPLILAIRPDLMLGRIRILVQQNDQSFLVEVKDSKKVIEGNIFNHNNQIYGGDIHFGGRFRVDGTVVYDRKARLIDIDHNHEYALFKLNLRTFTLEPAFHQNVHLFYMQLPGAPYLSTTLIQPASVGLFVRKPGTHGRNFKAGVSYGPGIYSEGNPLLPHYSLVGRANLRLSITF